jgi:hypothetical protein
VEAPAEEEAPARGMGRAPPRASVSLRFLLRGAAAEEEEVGLVEEVRPEE